MQRQFLVFEVPVEHTKVGAITQRLPGCTADLVGKPLIREEGHAFLLHYIVRGVDAETRNAMLVEMGRVYETVETLRWDVEAGVWELRGIIPVERIDSRGLRFVAGLFGLSEAPWIVFQGGRAVVRLLPQRPELMPSLAEAVDDRLASMGIGGHPRLEPHDLDAYHRRAASVGARPAA